MVQGTQIETLSAKAIHGCFMSLWIADQNPDEWSRGNPDPDGR